MSTESKNTDLFSIADDDPYTYQLEVGGIIMICGPKFRQGVKEAIRAMIREEQILIVDKPSEIANIARRFGKTDMAASLVATKIKKQIRNDEAARQRSRGKFTR